MMTKYMINDVYQILMLALTRGRHDSLPRTGKPLVIVLLCFVE